MIGLGLANALVALTGSLVAQQQGFADVGMGIGTIVAGLAGVIIGEVLFGDRSISWVLFSVIGGSIVYRLLIAVSLRLGIDPTDLKLLTAVLVVVALSIPTVRRKVVRDERAEAPVGCSDVRKVFFPGTANEVVALDGVDLRRARRPVRHHHRLERLGQVDPAQRDRRHVPADRRHGSRSASGTSPGSASTCAAAPSAGCSRTRAPGRRRP